MERSTDLEHRSFGITTPAVSGDMVVPEERGAIPEPRMPVRRPLPEHLEVDEERFDPAGMNCSRCGRERYLVREKCSERLDFISAKRFLRCTAPTVSASNYSKGKGPVQVIERRLYAQGNEPFRRS